MLPDQLEFCAVRLTHGGRLLGTGFCIGPGLVVTCAHVAGNRETIDVWLRGETRNGVVAYSRRQDSVDDNLFPDFTLIRVNTGGLEPVELDTSCLPGDRIHAWGFPEVAPDGDSLEGECEGFRNFGERDTQRLIKLKNTQITEGFSGSPVLNLRSGMVCGMLKRTRDEESPAGGYAVRAAILLNDPEIAACQRRLETPLRVQLREYLDEVVHHSGVLPEYFPPHIRNFDTIRQRIRVIADRHRFYTAAEERRSRTSVNPQDPYDPLHSRPEEFALDRRALMERVDRWQLERIGTVEWDRLRNDPRFGRLIILGDPGYGKTWLLRYEARRRANDCRTLLASEPPCNLTIPLTIKLQDLAHHVYKTQTFPQTLDLALESDGRSPVIRNYVARQLEGGRVAVLLDAWDEVEQERRPALRRQIEVWLRGYKGPMVLTSRPARFGASTFGDLPTLQLLAFEHSEITRFVHAWFRQDKALRFLDTLNVHRSINGLARIPLLLGLLCRVFDDPNPELPLRRGALCDRCLRGLLKDWKREDKTAEVDDLDVEAALTQLGRLALALYPASQFTITEAAGKLNLPADEAGKVVRNLIEEGILVRTGSGAEDRLMFLHRTFHEYLAAWQWSREGWNEEVFNARSWDVTWSQVIVLLAGQLRSSKRLISNLLRENADDPYRPRLALAIRCLQEMTRENRSSDLVNAATQQAIDLWLRHVREGTEQVLLRLESALPALPELNGHYEGKTLAAYLAGADPESFLSLTGAMGPDAVTAEVVVRLAGLLNDTEPGIRKKAADAAATLGRRIAVPEVLGRLITLADDKERWETIGSALNALLNLGEDAATPEVLKYLTEPIPHTDFTTEWVKSDLLAGMGPKAASPEVLSRVIEAMKMPRSANSAAYMLESLGEHAARPEVLTALVDMIQDGRRPVRESAGRALTALAPKSATPGVLSRLVDLLRRHSSRVAWSAATTLRGFGHDAATAAVLALLHQMMRDPDTEVRWRAVRVVGGLGKTAATAEILSALESMTEDLDWTVRWSAAEAVGELGRPAATSALIPRLTGWIRNGDWVLRWKASEALQRMAENASIPEALAELNDLMRYVEPEVRGTAASVMGYVGQDATTPDTWTCLMELTRDEESGMVVAPAVEALARLAGKVMLPEEVATRLLELSYHENALVRANATDGLGHVPAGAVCAGVVARLLVLLQEPGALVSSRAAASLVRLNESAATPEALAALTELVGHADSIAGGRAMETLWRLGAKAAVPETMSRLLELTRAESPNIRVRAVYALGRLGEAAATSPVLERLIELGRQDDGPLRSKVFQAIQHLGEGAATPQVIGWLRESIRDPEAGTRRDAVKTLRLLQQAVPNLRMPDTQKSRGWSWRPGRFFGALTRVKGTVDG
jgi:HEAT repeat protein